MSDDKNKDGLDKVAKKLTDTKEKIQPTAQSAFEKLISVGDKVSHGFEEDESPQTDFYKAQHNK